MEPRSAIVRRYLDAFASGDPDQVASLVSADFRNEHHGELASGCVGRDEYRRRLPGFLATFAGLRYTVVDIGELSLPDVDDGPDGDVVVSYRMQAEYDGTPIDLPGVMWFTVAGGEIIRRTDLFDSLSFLRQTGQASA